MALTRTMGSGQQPLWTLTLPRGLSNDEGLEQALLELYSEKFVVWSDRHRKYGRGNIAEGGREGILTRQADKIARIRMGQMDAADEPYRDTLIDYANYADILALWERGDWPVAASDVPICRGCGRALR